MVDPAGDIAVLAVPYAGATAVVREYGDALQGKVIIDITNPVSPDFQGFVTPDGSSGAQEIAKAAPPARMSFRRSTPCSPMFWRPAQPRVAYWTRSSPATTRRQRHACRRFIESLALRPMDTGKLAMARTPENVAL